MRKEELQRLIENLLAHISTRMVEMKMDELLKKEGEETGRRDQCHAPGSLSAGGSRTAGPAAGLGLYSG